MRIFLLALVLMAVLVFVRLVALRLKPASAKRPVLQSGNLEVKGYWFGAFDMRKGPSDPENFYEELMVEVGEPGSSETRSLLLHVGTARALAVVGPGEYAFVKDVIIVARYDAELIERAVRERLSELR